MSRKVLKNIRSNVKVPANYVLKSDHNTVITVSQYNALDSGEKALYEVGEYAPKLPQASDIEYGEIAINYGDGVETISIRNENNEIVEFATKDYADNISVDAYTKSEVNEMIYGQSTVPSDPPTVVTTDNLATTLSDYATLNSPNLTGTPTAPTAATSTDSTQIATTAFVHDVVEANAYELPTASDSVLGGVKVGTNLSIDENGVLSSTDTDRYVNTATFADDSTNTAASPVKMTLTRGGSDSATVTANIPKVSSTSAGVAPKGEAVSSQSQATKFLRSDGTWATPSYTENTNTTYSFEGGTNGFTVTPSGGSAQTVNVTPSIDNNVTGSAAWTAADVITTTNAASGNVIKASGKTISTTNPSSTSDDTTVPTSKAVWGAIADGIATNNAMVYKTTIAGGNTGAYGALTPAASKGWTYKVTTAGKVDGVAVEVGDMLICNTDNTAAATSSNYQTIAQQWDFIQTNIDGAVIGPSSATNEHVAVFDGTTGKLIKDSGFTIGTSVPADAVFTDNNTTYTFADGDSASGIGTFKVTPSGSGATTQKVTVYNVQEKVGALGSTTKPLYTSAAGTFAEGSTYAGGTKVTLNGADKGANTASFYAPTDVGTARQVLTSTGNSAPTWKTGEILNVVTNPAGTAGSTASGSYNRTQWTGSVDGITALYDNLVVLYKIPVAGVSKGVTLNINSLGEHPVVLGANSNISTLYPVGSIMPLVYDSTQTASVYVDNASTSFTGCWKIADANTTYSAGTLAQLQAGTNETDTVWSAKIISDYVKGSVNDGEFSIKTKVGSNAAVEVADFTANQSSADDITFIQGDNITLGSDTTNRTITISATDEVVISGTAPTVSGGPEIWIDTTSSPSTPSVYTTDQTYSKSETYSKVEINTMLGGYFKGTAIVVSVSSNLNPVLADYTPTNNNEQIHVIFLNTGNADYTVTITTTFVTPKGTALELTCPNGGYCEANFLRIDNGNSTRVFARGV